MMQAIMRRFREYIAAQDAEKKLLIMRILRFHLTIITNTLNH